VDELFVDYTFADTVVVRAGAYKMTWGRARLFDNPANLVDRVDEGAALRATVPTGPGSVTAVIYSREAWIDEYDDGNWRAFAGAGQVEMTFGAITTELSGHWQKDEPVGSALGLTLGLGELTLSLEGVYNWDQGSPAAGPWRDDNSWVAVSGVFWENAARSWSIWGEYQYDSDADKARDGIAPDTEGGRHLVGLAMRAPSLGRGGWRPGFQWRHAIDDDSGEIAPGIRGEVAPRLNLSLGVPVIYGKPGTYFRDALESENADDESEDDRDLTPLDNVVTVLVALRLTFSF
jgi:hypothetical protein